ncbi:MAG: hemerythrin domain-containing protein [Thermosphaera sp.]
MSNSVEKILVLNDSCGLLFSPTLIKAMERIRLAHLRELLELERIEHAGQTMRDLASEISKAGGDEYLFLDYRDEAGVNCLIISKGRVVLNFECLGMGEDIDKQLAALAGYCTKGKGDLRVYKVKPIFIEWSERYMFGIRILDQAHEEMFMNFQKVFTAIIEGMVDEVTGLIKNAYESVKKHFEIEENLMVKYNYPKSKRRDHGTTHAEFKTVVENLVKAAEEGRFLELYIQQYQFLITYLDYMLKEDKEFITFLLEKCGENCSP